MIIPAKKELTLEFDIEKVKHWINLIIAGKIRRFVVFDKNDVFNTYSFAMMAKYAGIISITLTKVDEDKTQASFEVTPLVGSYQDTATLTTILDDFLQILSKGLTGQLVTQQQTTSDQKGCLSAIIFFIFVAMGLLLACNKSSTNAPSVADGTFQYKVNGNLVSINNVSIDAGEYVAFAKQLQGTVLAHTRYLFNGQKGVNNIWIFAIQTDSLTTTSYSLDSTNAGIITTMTFNAQQSVLFYSSDYMNINITSYTNGLISGNFSAKFTPLTGGLKYENRGTTIITDGVFRNIKCIY